MPSLTEKDRREIETYYEIARANGALVSIEELLQLTSTEVAEPEFKMAFLRHPRLNSRFLLEAGYILEKLPIGEKSNIRRGIEEGQENRKRAHSNLQTAREFASMCSSDSALVSVSGGNSYLSAREGDDIDFFCVTKTDGVWTFMLKLLILARLFRLTRRATPNICFSCTMDERWATKEFKGHKDALFARDALTVKVIRGVSAYHALLQEATWIAKYFPSFYRRRLDETKDERGLRPDAQAASGILNLFLYRVVGSYITLKAWILNRQLRKAGLGSSIFEVKIGKDHCVYESNRYRKLRSMYRILEEG